MPTEELTPEGTPVPEAGPEARVVREWETALTNVAKYRNVGVFRGVQCVTVPAQADPQLTYDIAGRIVIIPVNATRGQIQDGVQFMVSNLLFGMHDAVIGMKEEDAARQDIEDDSVRLFTGTMNCRETAETSEEAREDLDRLEWIAGLRQSPDESLVMVGACEDRGQATVVVFKSREDALHRAQVLKLRLEAMERTQEATGERPEEGA